MYMIENKKVNMDNLNNRITIATKKKYGLIGRFTLRVVLLIISGIITIITGVFPAAVEGLEILFLLPASFGITVVLFGEVYCYFRNGSGFIILYAILLLRYLVSPLLIALSGHTVSVIQASITGYRFAIIMMIIELFTIVFAIRYFQKNKNKQRSLQTTEQANRDGFRLSLTGFAAVVFLMITLVLRGNLNNVFSHMNFLLNVKVVRSPLYTYDHTFVLTLKSFFFLLVASWAAKKVQMHRFSFMTNIYFLIAVVAGIINVAWYEAANRAVIVYTAINTVAVLLFYFPKKRKILIALTLVGIFTITGTLVVLNTLQFNVAEISTNTNALKRLSEIGELYSNGVSTMAHSFDIYDFVDSKMTIATYFSDVINYTGFITYPGFREIYYYFLSVPTTASLFRATLYDAAFIMPNAALTLYWGRFIFGFILDVIVHFTIVGCIYYFQRKRKESHNAGRIYVFASCEAICATALMNNIGLMFSVLTRLPLMLGLLLWFNSIGLKIRRGK